MSKQINVGCGMDIRKGWTNLDQHNTYGADVIFDLNKLYEGESLPFKDNTFDYVYCSHILEDFIEPMTIIEELIRICKVGGEIEIKTPFETNTHLTNIYHKSQFTLSKFRSLTRSFGVECYGNDIELKIKEIGYYADNGANKLVQATKKTIAYLYNLLPISLVERTSIKYLFCVLNCRVVYIKLKQDYEK